MERHLVDVPARKSRHVRALGSCLGALTITEHVVVQMRVCTGARLAASPSKEEPDPGHDFNVDRGIRGSDVARTGDQCRAVALGGISRGAFRIVSLAKDRRLLNHSGKCSGVGRLLSSGASKKHRAEIGHRERGQRQEQRAGDHQDRNRAALGRHDGGSRSVRYSAEAVSVTSLGKNRATYGTTSGTW